MKPTLATLKKEWNKLGVGPLDYHESRPHEMNNQGRIEIYLDHDLGLEFNSTGGTIEGGNYWEEMEGSRPEAIAAIIDGLKMGLSPMCDATKFDCGIE